MTCAQKLNLAENRLQACQKLGADRPQPNSPTTQVPVKAAGPILVKSGHECMPPNGLPNGDHEEYLGSFNDAAACAAQCKATSGCNFFVLAQGGGDCYWEYDTACAGKFIGAGYDVYKP